MAVYQIVELGVEILREKAKEVPEVSLSIEKLLDNMADMMYAAQGIGLAAVQIGIAKRVIIVDVGEGKVELINPVIIAQAGEDIKTEGCLSIPGVSGDVPRAAEVQVQGLDRQGGKVDIQAKGILARALQHEIDHLEGILFIDKAVKIYRQ